MFGNGGYIGYSMSVRVKEAYDGGEMPLSKWSKAAILEAVSYIDKEKAQEFKKAKLSVLREELLVKSSWHHTSKMFNRTDFYCIDEDFIKALSDDDISEMCDKKGTEKEELPVRFKGSIRYLTWSGTRRHKRASENTLADVFIEQRGSFYYVTRGKHEILKKKVGSNGTFVLTKDGRWVTDYNYYLKEKEADKKIDKLYKDNSSTAAYRFYKAIKDNCEYSSSYHIYEKGRKPSQEDYDKGLDSFFKKGEKRLSEMVVSRTLLLEIWDGKKWVREDIS